MAKKKPDKAQDEIQPLKVDIKFPHIMDIKQQIALDTSGILAIKIQFTANVDQFEVFRLVNLLKQPHEALYAIIGTNQSQLDFQFDADAGVVNILQSIVALPVGVTSTEPPRDSEPGITPSIKIVEANLKYDKVFPYPYRAEIIYVMLEGNGEILTLIGVGQDIADAILDALSDMLPGQQLMPEIFEAVAYLEGLEDRAECLKLINALYSNSIGEPEQGAN